MSTRIKWSQEETQQLLTNYHLHRQTGLGKTAAFGKALENLPASRRRKNNSALLSEFNKLYESRQEFKLDDARAAYNPDASPRVANSERIKWTYEEVKSLAAKWVELRLDHPFASATELLEKAQRACLPGERQRTFASILGIKPVVDAVNVLLLEKIEKLKAIYHPPAPPAPEIITLEVPRKLSAKEMLDTLDEPTLEALLAAKRLTRETNFHAILRGLASTAGAANLPAVTAFVPRLEVFDAGEKRVKRIAVLGLPNDQQDQARNEVINTGLEVELRFPTPKDSLTVGRCDFAIICRPHGGANDAMNAIGDRTIGQLGRNHVVLVDELTPLQLVQQVRNICSRQ